MLAREAADFKTSRQKSTEQKIGNLLQVRAPETIFSGKCGPRARAQSRHQTTKNKWYLRTMSPDDRSNP
jgi:hypothetical protein